MKVFITGATGYVGKVVLKHLLAAGHEPVCLVRPGSEGKLKSFKGLKIVSGDVRKPDTLVGAMEGARAVIYLVGAIMENRQKGATFEALHYKGAKHVIEEAKIAGVKRFLHMSAIGSRPEAVSCYHQTKFKAEEYLKASGLTYTIFRPSLIYGPGDDHINLFAKMIKYSPVLPVMGAGTNLFQPVYVETVAQGFVAALKTPVAANKVYEVGGPEKFSNDQLLDAISKVMGSKKR